MTYQCTNNILLKTNMLKWIKHGFFVFAKGIWTWDHFCHIQYNWNSSVTHQWALKAHWIDEAWGQFPNSIIAWTSVFCKSYITPGWGPKQDRTGNAASLSLPSWQDIPDLLLKALMRGSSAIRLLQFAALTEQHRTGPPSRTRPRYKWSLPMLLAAAGSDQV